MTLIDVLKTIDVVKRAASGTRVILGGPHVHIYPEETIQMRGVDYAVLGEGEECFKDLLENMDDHQKLRNIPEEGMYTWNPGAHFGIYGPDTFWFDT